MSAAYSVSLLETNLEWIRKQLKWLDKAKEFKTSDYFSNEYKKFKSREESLVGALSLLRRDHKRRKKHVSKDE